MNVERTARFGLVETSFKLANKLYRLEAEKQGFKVRDPVIQHSFLDSDGYTWELRAGESSPLAVIDVLHEYVLHCFDATYFEREMPFNNR